MNTNFRNCILRSYLSLFVLISLITYNVTTLATPKIYLLNVPLEDIPPANKNGRTLLVSMPKATPGFDTPALVYTYDGSELKYYDKSQWVTSPARMLLPLIVHSLEAMGKFRAVLSAATSPIACELRLDTEIVRLQQEFITNPSQVHLVFRAQLLDMAKRQVEATRVFEITKEIPENNATGGVEATNLAVEQLLKSLKEFIKENVR